MNSRFLDGVRGASNSVDGRNSGLEAGSSNGDSMISIHRGACYHWLGGFILGLDEGRVGMCMCMRNHGGKLFFLITKQKTIRGRQDRVLCTSGMIDGVLMTKHSSDLVVVRSLQTCSRDGTKQPHMQAPSFFLAMVVCQPDHCVRHVDHHKDFLCLACGPCGKTSI